MSRIREYRPSALPESALRIITHKASHLEATVQLNPRSELSTPEWLSLNSSHTFWLLKLETNSPRAVRVHGETADAAERDSDRWGPHTGECCVVPRYQTNSAPQSWPPYVPLLAKTLSMLCGGNATRALHHEHHEHCCSARASHAVILPSPSPHSIAAALAARETTCFRRAAHVRLLPPAVSPLAPRHAALHTLTACVVPCRRMLAGPRVMMGELNGAGWCD